ncbi:hypothetical protein MBLNU457_2104t1 [Dothideomycetes sp. NU457]
MEQTRAINALAPFLALAKSATSPRAAVDLVTQATSAQNTYVFAELLQTPAIQKLQEDTQYASHYKLLEIFAWGTWQEYQSASSSLPPLNNTQTHKLRLLTLLTLAARCTSSSQLTYSNLQSALSLSTPRELESLVTDAIYADLLSGTLNPGQQIVVITSVAPLRDLAPGSVASMISELGAWSQRCEGVLADLEAEMARVRTEAMRRNSRKAEVQQQMSKAAEVYGKSEDDASGARLGRLRGKMGGSSFDDDAMDLDGGNGSRGSKGKSQGLFGLGRKR